MKSHASGQAGGGWQSGPLRGRLLALLGSLPTGRVTTPEVIAVELNTAPAWVSTAIARMSEDEREMVPWHRVVAAGGAIGRGPWRETQFARLVREGIAVSPAGIVQDMGRVLLSDLSVLITLRTSGQQRTPQAALENPQTGPSALLSRSRGMKDRPGG